ncbi:type II secretion system protein GspL [Tateyamaria sp. syn59]|uniref:type II secretion system protein GspL n=1 Tax=Tateyamaria sp. syn59 TaxID=2576942 RepID=UPI0016790E77|nr:type II secretion system protein GspL [Tateyamaria sp. syn59]
MDDPGCSEIGSTAVFPLPSRDVFRETDPELKARLMRAAAASDRPSPRVIPGAAVLLLPLDLPLKSGRKRCAAARFAAEPFLATSLDQTHIAVGPVLLGSTRLCAAINRSSEHVHTESAGAALPDLCAVPQPLEETAWGIWCSPGAVYIRTSDGSGCVISFDAFSDVWRAFDRPRLELWHGTPPVDVCIAQRHGTLPPVSETVFALDLALNRSSMRGRWRTHLGFAMAASAFAGLAHIAVLQADARALDHMTTERTAALVDHASARGLLLDLSLPTRILTATLAERTATGASPDPFLRLMARTGDALTSRDDISFRDVRYDASLGTLTILISAADLVALQQTENALRAGGLIVTSGAASTGVSGAEMQLTLSEAT